MAEKFKTTRLSPIRVAVVTKKYNKHPKKILQEAIIEFENSEKNWPKFIFIRRK